MTPGRFSSRWTSAQSGSANWRPFAGGGGGKSSRSSAASSRPAGSGQDRPAVVARRRYSMTVVLPTPVASEMRRVDKPRACSRNTSSIFLIGSLLIAPPRPLSQQLPGSAVVCLRPAPRDGARSDHPGRMLLERVVGCSWNDRSDVHGIGGRITVVRAPRPRAPRSSRSPCENRAPVAAARCASSRSSAAISNQNRGRHRERGRHDDTPVSEPTLLRLNLRFRPVACSSIAPIRPQVWSQQPRRHRKCPAIRHPRDAAGSAPEPMSQAADPAATALSP